MSFSLTREAPADGVVVLTFTDPARQNQLCWAAIDALSEAVAASREQGARVVIIASGLPGHWLEHAWLQDLIDGQDRKPQTGTGAGWFTLQEELGHEDIISIAAVSGDCSGGGAEMGWACDIRVAERQARFAQPEVNMGIPTGVGGCSRLRRLAGRATVTEMVLSGDAMGAPRLYELGAINRLVEAGESVTVAVDLARALAAKPPAAVAALKRILAAGDELPLAESLREEQAVFQSVAVTEQAREGMRRTQAAYDRGESISRVIGYSDAD